MNSSVTKSLTTRRNALPLHGWKFVQPRDITFTSLGKIAGAQLNVWLAFGEPNDMPWITRSVIHSEMREQAHSTEVRVFSRAFERPSDAAWPRAKANPISLIKKST